MHVALGPYQNFEVNGLDNIQLPNPSCCSDPKILCGNCAALVLRNAGLLACNECGEVVVNEEPPDDDDLEEEEDDGWEAEEDDDDFQDSEEEEDEMVDNRKRGLTYMPLPEERPEPKQEKAQVRNERPVPQRTYRGRTGVLLTPVFLPGEK